MISNTLPSFWDNYNQLSVQTKTRAKKAYQLWEESHYHPSLHFKCINRNENIWSVRITRGYRAIGILDDKDIITWFWVGGHDEYEKFFSA